MPFSGHAIQMLSIIGVSGLWTARHLSYIFHHVFLYRARSIGLLEIPHQNTYTPDNQN
jgi:hypothetical protein